jgi:hypothetical protein
MAITSNKMLCLNSHYVMNGSVPLWLGFVIQTAGSAAYLPIPSQ